MESQLSADEMVDAELRQEIADIRYLQRCTGSELTGVKRELALVDAQAPVPPPPQAGWDRPPDRIKIRIASKAEIALPHGSRRPFACWWASGQATWRLRHRSQRRCRPVEVGVAVQGGGSQSRTAGGQLCEAAQGTGRVARCHRDAPRRQIRAHLFISLRTNSSPRGHRNIHEEGEACAQPVVSKAHVLSSEEGLGCGSTLHDACGVGCPPERLDDSLQQDGARRVDHRQEGNQQGMGGGDCNALPGGGVVLLASR